MKKKDLLLIVLFVGVIFISINVSASGNITCSSLFDEGELMYSINKYVFVPIKWITPILLLVLTSVDFAGVVFSGDKKGMDKAKNNFLKRAAAALIIFFAPDIINLIAKIVEEPGIRSCLNNFGVKN